MMQFSDLQFEQPNAKNRKMKLLRIKLQTNKEEE